MNHLELLKRAFRVTWRYRPLWLFGFLLALCGGGGGGGGGGGNVNFPADRTGGFENLPNLPEPDPTTVIILVIAVVLLVLLLILVSLLIRQVTRTALIVMVRRIEETGAVTTGEGWRLGWSGRAWRLFLVSLLIGVPVTLLTLALLLAAFSPLLLLLIDSTAARVLGIIFTVLAALLIGGLPAGLVYLISQSIVGAAIAGIPLALLALILISSIATGFYLVFQSTLWTLAYLQLEGAGSGDMGPAGDDLGPEEGPAAPAPDEALSPA